MIESKQYNLDESCQRIKTHIQSEKPFLIGKIGATELSVLAHGHNGKTIDPSCTMGQQAQNAAGIYPIDDDNVQQLFYRDMMKAVKNMDGISYWVGGDRKVDRSFVINQWETHVPEEYILRSLDVVNDNNWTRELDDKNVLVVTPFANTFYDQWKRKELWDEYDWCPNFKTLTFCRTNYSKTIHGQGFSNWKSEYLRLWDYIKECHFDVALLGCGSFGLPLGGRIKGMGCSAIHMGGCLQNMFGVKGKRWVDRPDYSCFMNDNWVSPYHTEIPTNVKNFSPIDGPCYF